MAKRATVTIPASSALSKHIRKGREGKCIACGQAIHTHLERGVWIGCQDGSVPDDATFVLVPTAVVRRGRQAAATADEQPIKRPVGRPRKVPVVTGKPSKQSTERRSTLYAGPRYLYMAADRRVRHIDATPAIQATYEALLTAKQPVTVERAAKLAKAPKEANRVRLNLLANEGLVTKTEVHK